ncbi:MAG TPA: GNAT family N-acetyltransferase [Thermoplasmata archaeon]|nr:GNAT family N-acetyltransferase [Thermoplasmata archaeon]
MQVRRLGAADAAAMIQAASLQDEPPDPTAVASYLADDRNVVFLATEGSVAVGFLRGTGLGQLKSVRRQMFLYEIAVDPAHHRRKVGTALIEALLAYCRERDYEEVFVFTDPGNTAAVGLYRSTGGITETAADRMFVYRLGG